jgi:hypothetical protein
MGPATRKAESPIPSTYSYSPFPEGGKTAPPSKGEKAPKDDSFIHFHPMLLLGLGKGGEKLGELEYTDGTKGTVSSGGLMQMGAGLIVDFTRVPLQLQASGTYHFDQVNAANGHISFSRWPVEALAFYKVGYMLRLGGGVQYALAPRSEAALDGNVVAINFNDSPGIVVEAGLVSMEKYSLGLNVRYVLQSYEAKSMESGSTTRPASSERISGSHFGANIFFGF